MGDSDFDDSDLENMEIDGDMSVEAVMHFFRYEHGKRFVTHCWGYAENALDGIEREIIFCRPSMFDCVCVAK